MQPRGRPGTSRHARWQAGRPSPYQGWGDGQLSTHDGGRGQSPYRRVSGGVAPAPGAGEGPPVFGGEGGGPTPPGGAVEGSAAPARSPSSVETQIPKVARDFRSSCPGAVEKRAARSRQASVGSAAVASTSQNAMPRQTKREHTTRRPAVTIRHPPYPMIVTDRRPSRATSFRSPREEEPVHSLSCGRAYASRSASQLSTSGNCRGRLACGYQALPGDRNWHRTEGRHSRTVQTDKRVSRSLSQTTRFGSSTSA